MNPIMLGGESWRAKKRSVGIEGILGMYVVETEYRKIKKAPSALGKQRGRRFKLYPSISLSDTDYVINIWKYTVMYIYGLSRIFVFDLLLTLHLSLTADRQKGEVFLMSTNQFKPIIGGIFGTHTEIDEHGNVVQKDDFHLRIYWDLFYSGAIGKLKGNMLHVYLTIAMHLDQRGEGWPTQERIAELCKINRETVVNSIKKLVEAGFIEAEKARSKGKFDNTVYKIKFAPKIDENIHDGKSDMEENQQNQGFDHVGKSNTVTMSEKPSRKIRHGKSDTKKDISFKEDPSLKKEQQQTEVEHDVVVSYKGEIQEQLHTEMANKDVSTLVERAKQNGKELRDYIHYVKDQVAKGKVTNPGGYLRDAVTNNWSVPSLAELEQAAAKEETEKAAVHEEYTDITLEVLRAAGIDPKEFGYQ